MRLWLSGTLVALALLPVSVWAAPPKKDAKSQQQQGLNEPLPAGQKKPRTPVDSAVVAAPSRGQIDLLCKNFQFSVGPYDVQTTGFTYESLTVTDASGARRQIYVPTSAMITNSFRVSGAPAGLRGEGLRDGECGVADAVIRIPSGKQPMISFRNPPFLHITHGVRNGESFSVANVWFAACPSGVRRFDIRRNNEIEFSATDTELRTSCVD